MSVSVSLSLSRQMKIDWREVHFRRKKRNSNHIVKKTQTRDGTHYQIIKKPKQLSPNQTLPSFFLSSSLFPPFPFQREEKVNKKKERRKERKGSLSLYGSSILFNLFLSLALYLSLSIYTGVYGRDESSVACFRFLDWWSFVEGLGILWN